MLHWTYLLLAGLLIAAELASKVLSSAHVILTKRDSRSALGWIGIIWLTPYIGAVLYVCFGINRIERKARKLRRRQGQAAKGSAQAAASEAEIRRVFGDPCAHLRPLISFVDKITHHPLLEGNRIKPLHGGDEAYPAIIAAIDAAEHSVGLLTYIFDNDPAGVRFADALSRATARGVEVRVLVDDVGTRYSRPTIKQVMLERGIPFATFLPTRTFWNIYYTNLRNHRKIVVVDGKLGFTGGMNIRRGHTLSDPGSYPVNDLHFQLEGPVVGHLQETFAQDWEFATGEHLDGPAWFPELSKAGGSLARGIPDGPELENDKIHLTVQGAIDCAQNQMTIVTPYFLPDQSLITAINVAAMRGVEVRILLPEVNNLKLVQWASTALLWQFLQRGCRIWLTKEPFDHTKFIVVDDLWAMFGSANLDPRSLRLNFEFNVECYDRDLACQMTELAEEKIRTGREIFLKDVDGRTVWQRLRDGIARLAQPYL